MTQPVSLARCDSYELDLVREALRGLLAPLGGMAAFVRPGQRVLVKPNLLAAMPPDRAITTHPTIVEAVVSLVGECGGRAVVADSPGPNYTDTPAGLRRLYRATGLLELAERGRIELAWDLGAVPRSYPEGRLVKRLDVIRPVAEADVIIALPKLKTHALTTYTGATKILFGTVPGLAKVGHHATRPDPDEFGELLLDILGAVKPALFVMDGILAMEGDGPGTHGTPRQLGALLASADAVALDLAACRLVGIDPSLVTPLRAARRRDLWPSDGASPRTVGTSLDDFVVPPFRLPNNGQRSDYGARSMLGFPTFLRNFVASSLAPLPAPAPERCTGCAGCVRACPAKAIVIERRGPRGRLAVVDARRCIRCYCCHELCPEAAIDLRVSRVGGLIRRLTSSPPADVVRR